LSLRGRFGVRVFALVPGGGCAAYLYECVSCAAGLTRIGWVLRHVAEESRRDRVNALVFVGDCVEENPDTLRLWSSSGAGAAEPS